MWIRHAAIIAAGVTVPFIAGAQTDYFNTDRGRPLHIQDAIAIERFAFELQAAPISWSRHDGRSVWSIGPELAYGILPRTQFEIGVPIVRADGFDTGTRTGLGALHVSVLHALNTETLSLPAMAFSAAYAAPLGEFGPPRGYPSVGLAATRTTALGRIHLNGDYTIGSWIAADDEALQSPRVVGIDELSRWMVGGAIDRTFPLRSVLIGGEVLARQPLVEGTDVQWQAGAGARWQFDPRWSLDAGFGRSFGPDGEWSLTFGAARSFGLIQFMPFGR
jgi:hypothetical protein